MTPPPPPAYWGNNWQAVIEEAEQERAVAARQFADAVHDYEAAANRCAESLHPAIADRLRDPHHRGLFGGIAHVVGGVGHTIAEGVEDVGAGVVHLAEDYVKTDLEIAGFVVEHLDVVSEGLGVASMAAGFVPGLQGVSLALSGAKLVLDLGLVVAGDGDWKAVGGDAAGFALFGLGRGLAAFSRSETGIAAATKVVSETDELRRVASGTAEGEQAVERTLEMSRLSVNIRRTREVANEFADDAARPLMRETLVMIRDFGAELPDRGVLSLSRGAMVAATAHKGVEAYEHYHALKEVHERDEKYGLIAHMEAAE